MVYVAALLVVAGVALYVAAPLFSAGERAGPAKESDLELERLTHERSLAVQALRELEFDREMHKLSEQDCGALRVPLEARAIGAMAAIERLRAERRVAVREAARPPRTLKPVEKPQRRVIFCPQCGVRMRPDANFCVGCGASLNPVKSLAMQAE